MILWFSRRNRDAAIERLTLAAYERGLEDGKVQGWQECEKAHESLKQKLIEMQRELAVADVRRRCDIERVWCQAWNEATRFAVEGNRAWMVDAAGKRAS